MSELNEKIYRIIEDATAGLFQEDVPYVPARHQASNEIEKLILQQKIDLLLELHAKWAGVNTDAYHDVLIRISELTNQLKALT